MTTKEKLLELFEQNRGMFFSGEDIGKKLSVSRASVWKAVKTLQAEGYEILAVTNKGYCLAENTDILSTQGIMKYLLEESSASDVNNEGVKKHKAYKNTNKSKNAVNNLLDNIDLTVMPIINSTNLFLKEKANAGAKEGTVVVANEQTNGRGRANRAFFSPQGTGIYMSILLRPNEDEKAKISKITTMAAVAMSEAVEKVTNKKAYIKWVNDIFVEGKKVCGILTEASFDLESGNIEYVVLGLGINVYEPENGFPEEIKDVAGSVLKKSENDVKNHLAAEFLRGFFKYYKAENSDYVSKYRDRCFVIGKEIYVIRGESKKPAKVRALDDDCHLLVAYEDGKEESLSSGEISIRLKI